MSDVGEGAVRQLVQQTHSAGALVHQVIECKSRANALGPIELVLAVGVLLAELTSAARKRDEAQQALVDLVLQTDEPGIVRMGMVSR